MDYKLPEAASGLDHGERHTSRTTIIVHQARVCENYHNISRVLFGELLYQNIAKVGKCSIFRQTLDGVSEPMTLSSDHPQSALCLEPFFTSPKWGQNLQQIFHVQNPQNGTFTTVLVVPMWVLVVPMWVSSCYEKPYARFKNIRTDRLSAKRSVRFYDGLWVVAW